MAQPARSFAWKFAEEGGYGIKTSDPRRNGNTINKGILEGNYAIIEVKTCNTNNAGITKDLGTLSLFVRNVGYERAIFLLFEYDLEHRHGSIGRV